MTDIARPSNPALSLSSFTSDPVRYRTYPDTIEILSPSPRTTITSDSFETNDNEDSGRSKSAPPNPSRPELELDKVNETTELSFTHGTPRVIRPDSAPPGRTTSSSGTSNPEFSVIHVFTSPATAGADIGGQSSLLNTISVGCAFENPNKSVNNSNTSPDATDNNSERTNADDTATTGIHHHRSLFSQFQQQEEESARQQLIDGRQLSRPIPQTPSRLSTILLPQEQERTPPQKEHGTLILRPNPIKAAEITTSNISPAELVRAAATEQVVNNDAVRVHHADGEATLHENTNTATTASIKKETTAAATEEKKVNDRKNWSSSSTTTSAPSRQAEIEAKRILKEAQEQRKQEFQVDFPENNNDTFEMPYAGNRSNEEKLSDNYNHHHSHPRNGTTDRMRQTQQQNHRDRMNSLRESSGAESLGNRNDNRTTEDMHAEASRTVQPTPLFERLVTEEVQELKTYAGIVERQNVELAKQKKVQEDLEARLRGETRRRKELESLMEEQERLWSEKFVELEKHRNAAEKMLQNEQTKTKKLINQVQRKDRDIHDFFKKKYDQDGGRSIRSSVRGLGAPSERNPQSSTASAARLAEFPLQSPQQLLNDLGSDEKVREGNAKNLLLDFFGI